MSRSDSWEGRLRLEWKPDTMTNIMFRPQFSYANSDNLTSNLSASFNADPYLYVVNPLAAESIAKLDAEGLMVNKRENSGISNNENKSIKGVLQFNRKFGSRGRNVTLRVGGNYGICR